MSYKYYNYEDTGNNLDAQHFPRGNHLVWETDPDGVLYFASQNDMTFLYRTINKFSSVVGIIDQTYDIQAGFPNLVNDKLYIASGTSGTIEVAVVDLTDGSASAVGSDITSTNLIILDIYIRDGNLEIIVRRTVSLQPKLTCYRWVDPNWTGIADINMAFGVSRDKWSYGVIIGTDVYIAGYDTNLTQTDMYKWNGTVFSKLSGIDAAIPGRFAGGFDENNRRGMAYDESNIISCTLNLSGTWTLFNYNISSDSWITKGAYSVSIMLDRNVHGTSPPFNVEKAVGMDSDNKKLFILDTNRNNLVMFSAINNITGNHRWITDHYVADASKNVFELVNHIKYIFQGWIFHSRNSFPYLEMKFNSDNITILEQMIIQIIGPYTADGSTTANQVVFEGITKKPTKGRVQYVLVENQGSEMEFISPRGNKSGRSDEIIVDINNDGPPDGPTYITDGTLANGGAMGLLDLSGAKVYRTVLNDLAEHDVFLWNLRPQGTLDYNDGSIDSGADLRHDISTYTDTIVQVLAWTIAKLNQIIVNGAINTITGEPYTGKWDEEEDQQVHEINGITIEDAQLNTNALCQTKADGKGANESVRIRVKFKFRKTTYGFIQPGQTITFLYDITNYMTISSAQYILDKLIMNIKTEIGYAEISSGL